MAEDEKEVEDIDAGEDEDDDKHHISVKKTSISANKSSTENIAKQSLSSRKSQK